MGDTDLRRLQPGELFASDFAVERVLAEGGMGAVYVALQASTGRRRALKLMHPRLVADAKLRARFEREAKVGGEIESDHVVEVVAAGVDDATGMPYLAMELLDGESLHARVERAGPLAWRDAATIAAQIAHALGAAHGAGIVHRDLKPENVFLVKQRREGADLFAKVLDFGIAKATVDSDAASRTAPVGTPLWMAPEQANTDVAISPATDVWAFGLLVYWMLTGRIFWKSAREQGASAIAVLKEVVLDPLPPCSDRATEQGVADLLPPSFDAWFERCVSREPGDRFPDAVEARRGLEAVLDLPPSMKSDDAGLAHAATQPISSSFRSTPASSKAARASARTEAEPIAATAPSGDLRLALEKAAAADSASASGAVGTKTAASPPKPSLKVPFVVGAVGLLVGAIAWSSFTGRGASTADVAASAASASAAVSSPPSEASAKPKASTEAPQRNLRALVTESDKRWKIPIQSSPRAGAEHPLATVVAFGNFQCPGTRRAVRWMREMIDAHPDDVALVWKEDPIAIHERSQAASHLAREAAAQLGEKGFWEAGREIAETRRFDDAALSAIASRLKLASGSFEAAWAARRYQPQIESDIDLADALGAEDTPTIFINGLRFRGAPNQEAVGAAVESELTAARKKVDEGKLRRETVLDQLTADGIGPQPFEMIRVPGQVEELYESERAGKVTIFAVGDHTDPLSVRFTEAVAAIAARRPNDISMAYIENVRPGRPESLLVAIALYEAFSQKGAAGLGPFRRLIVERNAETPLDAPAVLALAKQAGLDTAALKRVLEQHTYDGVVLAGGASLQEAGFTKIPSYAICATKRCADKAYLLSGLHAERSFEVRIEKALADAAEE